MSKGSKPIKSTAKRGDERGLRTAVRNYAKDIRKGTIAVELIFLLLGLVFGVLFLLDTPPFQAPDEPVHFYRVYQITQGDLLPQRQGDTIGGTVPASLGQVAGTFSYLSQHREKRTTWGLVTDTLNVPLRPSDTTFLQFPGSALYSPMAYAPQVVGVGLGRIFGLGPLYLMYLARMASLLAWLALGFVAIRIIPSGKWALLTIFFVPMLAFLAPSASADSFVFGLMALVVALSVKYACSHEMLQRKDLGLILALSVVISLIKPPYSLAFLMFLFIPLSKYEDRKTYAQFWGLVLLLALGSMGAWSLVIQGFYIPARPGLVVSPQEQMAFVTGNPMAFLNAIYQTYWNSILTNGIFSSWTGVLGWLDTALPVWLSFLTISSVTVGLLSTGGACVETKKVYKWIAGLLPVGIFVMINLALYLSWSGVGADVVDGIQGRYFLPVTILFIPWLTTRKTFRLRVEGLRATVYMTLLQSAILGYTVSFLVQRYWV